MSEMPRTFLARLLRGEYPYLVLAGLSLLLFGPFLGKALHIDDPLFVWTGQWLANHPLDFYGRVVNWYGFPTPMFLANQNPPATAYLLAAVGSIFGWSEAALHGGFLVVTFAAAAGMHRLAHAWGSQPLLTTVLVIASPVFLVTGTTLMCDMLLLAFWVWTLVAWDTALGRPGVGRFLLAGTLAAAAILTKYSAVFLLPIMLVTGAMRRHKLGWWLATLLCPLVAMALFELASIRLYGHGLVLFAGEFAGTESARFPGGWSARVLCGLAFLGGGLLPATFLLPLLYSRRLLLAAGAVPGAILFALIPKLLWQPNGVPWGVVAQFAFLSAAGLYLLVALSVEIVERRDALGAALALWIGLGLLFVLALNWTVSGRTLLPTVFPVVFLLVGRYQRRKQVPFPWRSAVVPLVLSFVPGVLAMVADHQLAAAGRRAATNIVSQYRHPGRQIWFDGHWGFQYYMESLGAKPLDHLTPKVAPQDLLVISLGGTNLDLPNRDDAELVKFSRMRVFPWLTTMQRGAGAGFYAAQFGPMPFAFGRTEPDSYVTLRVLRPLLHPSPGR